MKAQDILATSSAHAWVILCVGIMLTASASAQNQRYYPQNSQQPQYSQPPTGYQQPPAGYGAPGYAPPQQQKRFENPLEFLPKFGRRLSEMTRRLFYGQDPTGWDQPPSQGYSLEANPRHATQPGYAQPPAGYYPQQPAYQQPQAPAQAQPRYSYPPSQTPPASSSGKTSTPAPQKSSPSTTRTYTPPKVTSSAPKTATPQTSAPAPAPKPSTPAPTPPTTITSRRTETTPPPEAPKTASSSSSFPKGGKTSKPGRVTSPYPPYKELDVTGLDSGSLALDPTTQKVFEVP